MYHGMANPGIGEDAPKWLIKKFTYDAKGSTTTILYADGSREFNH